MLNRDDAVPQPRTADRLAARTGRTVRHRWLYMSAAAAALLAGIITVVSGPATAQTAPPACLSGYVCLVLSPSGTGNVALVTATKSQTFPKPGLTVTELANNTTTLYCLFERLSNGATTYSSISAGSTQNVSVHMLDVFPGSTCPA